MNIFPKNVNMLLNNKNRLKIESLSGTKIRCKQLQKSLNSMLKDDANEKNSEGPGFDCKV